jgi:DNA primase
MTEEQISILSVIKSFLGDPKKNWNEEKLQMEFNCPSKECKHDNNKYNLSVNLKNNVFNCWKCSYRGPITKLVYNYGKKESIERINLILPKTSLRINKNSETKIGKYDFTAEEQVCKLPDEYISLTQNNNKSKYYNLAKEYLKKRKVGDDIIEKYKIGYTEEGAKKFRIIIPSYNKNGNCNYYEARSFVNFIKPSYLKPDYPHKLDIIFNEKNINFDLPVYLVEGVFDMFPLYNSIPLLGKDISQILLHKIVQHKTKIILCLDEDAIKDTEKLYNLLSSVDIDVWFVEIPNDVAFFYQKNGKEKLIELLKTHRKMDFRYYVEKRLDGTKIKQNKKSDLFKYELDKLRQEIKNEQK